MFCGVTYQNAKMNLWNIKNLAIPPINTYKAENTNIDIKYLGKVFREGKKYFDKDNYMSAEYKVMSIIVYRTKQKFRSSKDFKALDKIYKALGNYFKLNISKDLQRFINIIPGRYTDETYLPNKSILDYILVRLQGMIKLLERIIETCKITADLFNRRLHTGHFWKLAFIIFSLVSRIYILAKCRAKFVCDFYNKIVPFSRQLKNSGRNWLPENYFLPTDLKKWMNVNWLDIDDELEIVETSDLSNIAQFFDLVDDDDDVEFCNEYIMIDDDDDMELANEFKKLEDVKKTIQNMRGFDMDEDIGEVIEVDDSLLFNENVCLEKDNINSSKNLPETNVEENNTTDFGEIIEVEDSFNGNMFTQIFGKRKLSDTIILDNSLSDSENCNEFNDIIELDDSFQINETVTVPKSAPKKQNNRNGKALDKEALTSKSPKTKSNTNRLPKEYSNNISASVKRTLTESNDETLINISDSPSLHENENNNTRNNFKIERDKNTNKNFDTNKKSKCNTLTENETNKKRKLEFAESSCKKTKKINWVIEQSPDAKINSKKHDILVRSGKLNVRSLETNSPQIKIKEEPILIKDDESSTLIGVESNKKKCKKIVNSSICNAQQTNNLEKSNESWIHNAQINNFERVHKRNKNTLRKNILSRKKKKQKKLLLRKLAEEAMNDTR